MSEETDMKSGGWEGFRKEFGFCEEKEVEHHTELHASALH